MAQYTDLIKIRSAEWQAQNKLWEALWLSYDAGDAYKTRFLLQHDSETALAYKRRYTYSYVPCIAKSAILTLVHHIGLQLPNVERSIPAGLQAWIDEVNYEDYLQNILIPELLVLGESYTFVEPTYIDSTRNYNVLSENIREETLLYRVEKSDIDSKYNLPTEHKTYYRYWIGSEWIEVDSKGNLVATGNSDVFPVVHAAMPYSLMQPIYEYQIAALNLNSVDVDYLNRSGFPVLTMQISQDENGNSVVVGHGNGIAYGEGTERPDFVSPSPENTVVSIAKQQQINEELMQVLDLSAATMSGQVASGVSKAIDKEEMVGLGNVISSVMQRAEMDILTKAQEYLGIAGSITVTYPKKQAPKITVETETYDTQSTSKRVSN